jgi:outer membrane receptor protein involved in Fe transport
MIPIRAVEKIEVIRGPFSALYGSSGGGGVINIVTKDGDGSTYVAPFFGAGDYGRNDYGVNAGVSGDNFSFGLFYDRKEVENYYLYDDFDLDDTNLGYSHDRVHFKLTGTLGQDTDVHVSGGTVVGTTDYGIGQNLGIERYKDYEQPYLNFQASRYLSDKLELKGRGDWLSSESDYFGETLVNVTYPAFGPPIPSFNYSPSVNHTASDRSSADLTLNYYFTPDRILTLGSEAVYWNYQKGIRHSETGELLEVQGREGEETDMDDTLYSVYAQYDTLFFDTLELVLGARYDNYDSYGSEVSPKGTLRWNYRKGGNIKLSVGKGFRAPNLNQLYSSPWSISQFIVYQGNPDLEAERLVSYEFSLEQYALDYALFFRMTPYYTDAEDFITSVRETDPINPSGQIMFPRNVDEVTIKGVDLEVTYRVDSSLTLFANYNYNETEDGQTGELLDCYPKNSGSLRFRGNYYLDTHWRLFGSYSARYRGEWTETSWGRVAVTESVGDYWWHNASVGVTWQEMITLKIDGFNLFNDRTAIGIDDYPAQRNFLAEVSMKYTF